MLGVTDIWTFVIGTVAIILLPGPNSLYVLSTAARRGIRQGYRAAAGVFLGDWVLMIAAALGVASLLRAYPPVFLVVKYAGAAYLAFIGITMIWRSLRSGVSGALCDAVFPRRSLLRRSTPQSRRRRLQTLPLRGRSGGLWSSRS